MVEAGTQKKKYFKFLTGIGFIISIGLLIFFKQHPTYFQVWRNLSKFPWTTWVLCTAYLCALTSDSSRLSDYSWWDDKCYWLHCIWTYLGIYL